LVSGLVLEKEDVEEMIKFLQENVKGMK